MQYTLSLREPECGCVAKVSDPMIEVAKIYQARFERAATSTIQVGIDLPAYASEILSPPAGATVLWRVILLPEGDTFGHSRGFTLTPSSYVLPLITQSSTGQSFFSKIKSRATGRNRHKILHRSFTNSYGQVTLSYPICAGENFKLQNNNSYPVFCVLCYEIKEC